MTDHQPDHYLGACDVIDWKNRDVSALATELKGPDATTSARRCFEFVRDEIRHSSDFQLNPVTCRASEVLEHGTGYCYAKSHLLCALLRANGIPAGLCYQRLTIDGDVPPFCLHGLVAIHLPDHGWYRVDPRGNRDGIDARFEPPVERLAFTNEADGECLFPEIHVAPLAEVVRCLTGCETWEQVYDQLPDRSGKQVENE